jgi:hypothetical protein
MFNPFINYTMKNVFFLFVILSCLASCQKELSFESGGKGPDILNACKISEFTESDVQTARAEVGYNSTYDTALKVTKFEIWDSVNNVLVKSFAVNNATPNRVVIDADQFFVTGTDGRVTEYHGYEDPMDPTSQKVIVRFTYNSAGQLVKRTMEDIATPGVIYSQMDYIYSGGNLTKAEVRAVFGTTTILVIEVMYEYDATKKVKDFIKLNAAAAELFYFQTAIDAGVNSTDAVTKTTVKTTNPLTGVVDQYITEYVNYDIDAQQHVKSFEVIGFDFSVGGLVAGKKYLLKYACK